MPARKITIAEGSRHVIVESEDDPLTHILSSAIQAWGKTSHEDSLSTTVGFEAGAISIIAEKASGPEYMSKHEGDLGGR